MVRHITGIVGQNERDGSEVGLYEIVEGTTGVGVANRILQLNMHTPIAEAFFPTTVVEQMDASRDPKTNLTYKVRTEPHNPNSYAVQIWTCRSK